MSLQLFGSTPPIKPLPLTEEAKQMRQNQTNFLAFSGPKRGTERMAGDGASINWAAELDDTFAKPGVWQFRYQSIAPRGATGTGYIDTGVAKSKQVELQYGHKSGQALVKARMGQPHPAWQYQSYGYQENATGYAPEPENMSAPKEKSTAQYDDDEVVCPSGYYLLNGRCTDA